MAHTKPSITPEMLTPRLGEYLVLQNRITSKQLNEALEAQKTFRKNNPGKHGPLVGEILVERGFVEKAVVDRSVTELIFRLKTALEESNASLEERVKERTQELEFALNKINVLNSHKSEFVSNISHELRTPLTHIVGYTYLFLDGTFGEFDEEQMDAFNAIKDATDRLENLIMDLVSFSDIEQGKMLLARSIISPFDVCQPVITAKKENAKEKKIQLLLQCDTDLPKVYVDVERIQWVLRQFISNSIKFTPEGGYVLIKAKQNKKQIKFSVTDTGIGIPKEKLVEIFEPFLQLDGSSTRNAGGTGIGLTICKEIIEAHNSSITVNSEIHKGTEFAFSIPVTSEGAIE